MNKKNMKNNLKELDELIDAIESNMQNYSINDHFKRILKNLLKKYSLQELINAVEISAETYIYEDTEVEYNEYLNKIKGIAFINSMSNLDKEINYIVNFTLYILNAPKHQVKNLIIEYCYALRNSWNYSDEDIIKDLKEELKPKINKCKNFYHLSDFIENWISEIKN